jgi:hypothetical protein
MQWPRAIYNKILKVFNFDFSFRHNMTADEPKRTPKHVKVGIVENIAISDSVSATKGVYFELTEPVIIPGLKVDGGDIKLVFDDTNIEKLIGFRIWVSGNLQDNIRAYQKDERLTNLLTQKTGRFIFHKRPREFASDRIGQELKSIVRTPINNTLVNLNISDSAIESLLDSDSFVNQQLAHFSNAIKALEAANFGEAIKEFHQVVENNNTPSHLANYKYLRDGLSHNQLDRPNTINHIQNDFGITLVQDPTTKMMYINTSDPAVQVILEKEANYLLTEVWKFIEPKVGIKTD